VDQAANELRLNQFIAHAGVCSRREADELIANGLIKVNGKVVNGNGLRVKHTDTR
jgi:23S rRNA pseudouridine2605 synthase